VEKIGGALRQQARGKQGWRCPALRGVRENFSRPSGTGVSLPLFPALKRRAIGRCPSGAGFLRAPFHHFVGKRVLTHGQGDGASPGRAPSLQGIPGWGWNGLLLALFGCFFGGPDSYAIEEQEA
jgi:hypothetical protein